MARIPEDPTLAGQGIIPEDITDGYGDTLRVFADRFTGRVYVLAYQQDGSDEQKMAADYSLNREAADALIEALQASRAALGEG